MQFDSCRMIVAAALIASAACVSPIGPGSNSRKDPGTLIVRVHDSSGAPIAGVWVYVELPNDVGSFFKEGTPTRADGSAAFFYVPAGRRSVEATLPAGFSADELKRDVDVLKGQSVISQFTLQRL